MSKRPAAAPRLASIGDLDRDILELVERRARLVLAQAASSDNGRNGRDLEQAAQHRHAAASRRGDGPSLAVPIGSIDAATARAISGGNGLLPASSVAALLRHVAAACQSLLSAPRIAFSGPLYGLGHLAAIGLFGDGIELAPVGNLAAVFDEVDRGQSDFGLAPLDNSAEGRLAETLELLRSVPVRICEQIEVPLRRTLMAKCSRGDVRETYGTPEALSACRNWLAKHLPAARSVEVASAASAGQLAAERRGAAAVASVEVGPPFGIGVLAENIEDHGPQIVRWAVIGRRLPAGGAGGTRRAPATLPVVGRRGPGRRRRTAMLLELANRPGALADVLAIFKREKLNVTRIESLPAPGAPRRSELLVELHGDRSGPALRQAMAAIKRKTLRLDVLGSYPS